MIHSLLLPNPIATRKTPLAVSATGYRTSQRTGGVTVVMAVVLPMLAILAAFAINTAHMQLTKTELMIASDAAARSAGRTFSEEQTVEAAELAAQVTAALNNVNNEPLQLRTGASAGEIEFGASHQSGNAGRFEFEKIPTSQIAGNELLVSSVRINAKRNADSLGGKVDLIFPSLMARKDFSPTYSSVAMQVDRDISLVLDRSGSMEWRDYSWPGNFNIWSNAALNAALQAGVIFSRWGNLYYSPGQNFETYQQFLWEEHLDLGPAPPTPWQDLVSAVNTFLDVLEETPQNEQVSIATYASNGTLNIFLTHNYQDVRNVMTSIQVAGATGIGNGMLAGQTAFTHANSRPFASKTMVVMTDGHHNSGIHPSNVAHSMMGNDNVTIQTITFTNNANQSDMQNVARIGAGKHYHANSGAELTSVFEEIANNLPTILTK